MLKAFVTALLSAALAVPPVATLADLGIRQVATVGVKVPWTFAAGVLSGTREFSFSLLRSIPVNVSTNALCQ